MFPDWEDPNGEAQCRCDEEDSGERRLTHSQQVFLQTGEKAEQLTLWPKERLPEGASAGLSSSTQSAEAGGSL